MRDLAGKTAFVTGGASGIGFALGRAFGDAGVNVMLADIKKDALESTSRPPRRSGLSLSLLARADEMID